MDIFFLIFVYPLLVFYLIGQLKLMNQKRHFFHHMEQSNNEIVKKLDELLKLQKEK
ncbi:hypothetical protein [Chengkuizengella axinellae]|uniref:DUF4083 domain-containing protein n=1 Tax=Chengkuizengella axinellae TaxID=3064388 RepID=A0ABT9J0P1_9BACL|nr:hypothetical protein [Chengkuizengella sp. 2205SS18-9]MDP5275185.1 hypothetical protein [Chengkuizengella sp. 2205SS18-9]